MYNTITKKNRKKKATKEETTTRSEDVNPVYGFYYFVDGQHVDDNNAEATDENQYYET